MPTYVFKEKGKRKLIEVQMKISELDSFKLNNPKLKQIPTAPSFTLKGTGLYETDLMYLNILLMLILRFLIRLTAFKKLN